MSGARLDVFARYNPYLERYVEVTTADGVVTSVSFPTEPDADADDEHDLIDRIEAYLSGTVEDDFEDVEIELHGTATEQAVLTALREIPYGRNASVEDLLRAVPELDSDSSEDADVVREILDANPVPLIVPDHRVRDGPSAAPPGVEQRLRSLEKIAT